MRRGGLGALGRVCEVWALAAGGLLLAIVALTGWNVAALSVGAGALPGYEDAVMLFISAAALMVMPLCQHRSGHVIVDFFLAWAPQRLRDALDRAWLALTAAVAVFLAVWMARGMAEARADGGSSPILGWPEWPFYAPGIASLALWAVVAARQAAASGRAHGA